MINPGAIPQIPGDMDVLAGHAGSLTSTGSSFSTTGAQVNSTWQGLAGVYDAPEAAQLFAATGPVATISASVGSDISSVGGALSTYASTVRPIKQRLEQLRTQATQFVSSVADDEDWKEDGDKVDRHNGLISEVNKAVEAWMNAQRDCANSINVLYGGTQWKQDNADGNQEANEFGYSAATLDEAQKSEQGLPWGKTKEQDHGFLGSLWEGTKGFFVDGLWGGLVGLGKLVGLGGWDAFTQSWTGIGNLVGFGGWDAFTDSWTGLGKGLLAWDEWSKNPGRAFGQVLFNVVTLPFVFTKVAKVGAVASATEKIGAAAGKVGTVVGKVGNTIDKIPTAGELAKMVTQKLGNLPTFGRPPAFAGAGSDLGHIHPREPHTPHSPHTAHMDVGDGTGGGSHLPDHPGSDTPHVPDSPTPEHHDGPSGETSSLHRQEGVGEPHPALTNAEKQSLDQRLHNLEQQHPNDFAQLERDPDKSGAVSESSRDEARVALDLRDQGRLPVDLQRPPHRGEGDYYSPSENKYYDLKGVHSDWPPLADQRDLSQHFKGAYNPDNNLKFTNKIREQIEDLGRDVVIDTRNANQAAIDDLKKIVEDNGWGNNVIWYP